MYTEIWHTCFFYLTKRFYEKILFEPDHIARKLFCNEHVKIKIFISKKEILSIQNDGYLMDKMAKNVIMRRAGPQRLPDAPAAAAALVRGRDGRAQRRPSGAETYLE